MTPSQDSTRGCQAPAPDDQAAARASQRAPVRRGQDVISHAYRTGHGPADPATDEDPSRYLSRAAELAALIPGGPGRLGLGCRAGLPGTLALTGHDLTGSALTSRRFSRPGPGGSSPRPASCRPT